jgi:glycosyltransferase involved in cell wall biosynthesis
MKVLVLHNIVSPHVLPYFEGLANASGVDLSVWFLDRSTSVRLWETTLDGAFRSEILPGFRLELPLEERVALHFNPSVLWRIPIEGFDVVVLFAGYDSPTLWLAALMCRMLGIPMVVRSGSVPGSCCYGGTAPGLARLRRRASRFLVRGVVRSARSWIAYGSRSKRYLIELGAHADRIHMVWNTVRVEGLMRRSEEGRCRRQEIRAELGIRAEDVLFLYVGRFQACKNLDMLIDGFSRVRTQNAILGFVGYGPEEADLRRRAGAAANVRFFGAVSLDRITDYYVASDTFVLPSGDIWGLVVNEAMACGLPVIAANTVGSSDDLIVHGENGYVYPWDDLDALANALDRLATDAGLRVRMGAASQSRIQRFTYQHAVPELVAAIREAYEYQCT